LNTIGSLAEGSVAVERLAFDRGRRNRRVVAAAEGLTQPLELLAGGFAEPWLAALHASGHGQAAQDVACYFLCDAGVSGIGHLFVENRLVTSEEVMPDYWLRQVRDRHDPHVDIDVAREQALPERRIDGATVVFCGWGVRVYGHFLIETLPKLMAARQALGREVARMQFLVPADAPDWLLRMAAMVVPMPGPAVRRYDPARERVRLTNAVVPTLASRNGWFHPWYGGVVDALVAGAGRAAAAAAAPWLFVTRGAATGAGSMRRRCRNEARLAEIAAREFGFAVIAPETMGWAAQIAAFAGAETVVGTFGSGLHNALFCGRGTRVGAIGFLNLTQSMIGALRGHRNAYLPVVFDESGFYAVDEGVFRQFLRAVVEG
jgi:capsular polysaccharide biosynthesis protein